LVDINSPTYVCMTLSVLLFTWTLCRWCLCFELHIMITRSMSSVFTEHQLLHCKTIE